MFYINFKYYLLTGKLNVERQGCGSNTVCVDTNTAVQAAAVQWGSHHAQVEVGSVAWESET